MPSDGNFQDFVSLSGDTLSHKGAMFAIGTTSATSVTFGMSNSAGLLALVAAPTGNATVNLPTGGGTLLTNINLSAGTTSGNLSAVTFANSNGVSFGLNASTLTASVATSLTNINVSAGTTSNNLSAITFSNSNGVSFGLNGSVITASAAGVGGGVAVQAGTQTATGGTVVFSNSNGVTFGMSNSSVVTVSINTTLSVVNFSAGTTSGNLSSVVFSNSNGVSFGLNGSTVTASYAINVSAGTTSNNLSAITFSNSNGVSFGLNGSTLTGSVATSLTAINLSAGTTSNNLSAFTLSNSNNVSFGLNGSTVTASANLTNDWYDNVAKGQPVAPSSLAMGSMTNFTGSASSLFVAPLHGYGELFPFDITANTVFFPDVSISGSTATMSVAFTSVWFLGIYTLNASSLSLLNSASFSFGFAGAATNNSTGFAGGYRYLSASSNVWSSSPVFKYGSRYWLGWFWSSSGAVNQTGILAGAFNFSTGQRSGLLGASNLTATSNGAAPFMGIYTAQTAALPGSIGSNQLQKTASIAGFVPHLIFANNASLTVF